MATNTIAFQELAIRSVRVLDFAILAIVHGVAVYTWACDL